MSATHDLLRFGVFELNVTSEELRKSGALVKLAPQPLKLLALLARRSGQLVTREEIEQTLWGGETYVDFEQGMNHCIKQIRTALSDNADAPVYIETIPRRGYRFLAPVVMKTIPAPPPMVVQSQSGVQNRPAMPGSLPGALPTATAVATPPLVDLNAVPTSGTAEVKAAKLPLDAELKPAISGVRWKIIAPAIIGLIAAIAGVLYWRC